MWTYYNDGKDTQDYKCISEKNVMRKICFQRGSMNDPDFQSYFFVEKSPEGGASDLIKELRVDKSSFISTIRTVYSLHSR